MNDVQKIINQLDNIKQEQKSVRELCVNFLQQLRNNCMALDELSRLGKSNAEIPMDKIWQGTLEQYGDKEIRTLKDVFGETVLPNPIKDSKLFFLMASEYAARLNDIQSQKEEDAKREIVAAICEVPFAERPLFGKPSAETDFRSFRQESCCRIAMPEIPVSYQEQKPISDITVPLNLFYPETQKWQTEGGKPNFRICSDDFETLETLTTMLLISFPIGKMKLNIIDLGFSRELSAIKNRLNKTFIESYILDEAGLCSWLQQKNQQLQRTFSEVGDVVEHNLRMETINGVYELCILNEIPSSLRHDAETNLRQLLRQGHRAGLYFVVIDIPSAEKYLCDDNFIRLSYSDYAGSLYLQEERRKLIAMLNSEVENEDKRMQMEHTARKQRAQASLHAQEYLDATEEFSVEVGNDADGHTVYFTLEKDSPHRLILGKTGSGKSNFLHLLLTGSMLKYGPDTLQFYLMDLKAGVELMCYRDVYHVHTLVAGAGDAPIFLEFLSRVSKQIEERGKIMGRAGVRDFQSYNRKNPLQKLPRMIILIDEFQVLFDRENYPSHSDKTKVESLLSKILKQGRSSGFNAILSTQTLAGTQIPQEVAQIGKQYFLKAENFDMQDLHSFVHDIPEKELNDMASHEAFSVTSNGFQIFMPELLLDEDSRSLENRLTMIREKSCHQHAKPAKMEFYSVLQTEWPNLELGLQDTYYDNYPTLSLGRTIEINSKNKTLHLENAKGQNLLIVGTNEQGAFCTESDGKWQGLRILLTAMISLIHYSRKREENARFILFLNSPMMKTDGVGRRYIDMLLKTGGVEIVNGADADTNRVVVERILERVRTHGKGNRYYLFMEGQDYYNLFDYEIIATPTKDETEETRLFSQRGFPFGSGTGQRTTLRDGWLEILEKGPTCDIYTVWQIQNFNRLIPIDNIRALRTYFQFNAILYNNSITPASVQITNSEIDFKQLNATSEGMRLCIFDGNEVSIIAPYQVPCEETIGEVINR